MKKIIYLFLNLVIAPIANSILNFFEIFVIFRNGSAIGDHVYMSSIIRLIKLKKKKIILFTNYPELYFNNKRIYKLYSFKIKSNFWFLLSCCKGKNILEFNSVLIKENTGKHFMFYHKSNKIPLAQAMSEHFNLNLDYSNLKNEFFFSEKEIKQYENTIKLPANFALIQSCTKKTFTSNKDWKLNGIQNIINSFQDINWIQIGKSHEPRLSNCLHFLNLKLRELAYIIYKSDFIVSYEGLFNHLAACFEKKNFLIHSGFLHIDSVNYKNNIVIDENNKMNCYPCFNLHCENHTKNFVNKLSDEKVINCIRSNI